MTRFPGGFGARVALTFSLLILLLLALFGALSVHRFRASNAEELRVTEALLREQLVRKGLALVNALALASEQALAENNFQFLLDVLHTTTRGDEDVSYGLITDASGRVLVHSEPGQQGRVWVAAPGRELLTRQGATAWEVPAAAGRPAMLEVAAPIGTGVDRLGTLRLGLNQQSLERDLTAARERQRRELRRTLAAYLALTLGCVLLGLVSAVALGAQVTRPLSRLTRRAQSIGEGNLDVAVPDLGRRDEVGVLGKTLERMRLGIRALLEEQRALAAEARRRAVEWEHVLSSITDAVWIFDAEARTTFANAAAGALLGVPAETLVGRRLDAYAELLGVFGLDDAPVPPGDWPAARALRGELQPGVVLRLDVRGLPGSRFVRTLAAPVEGGERPSAVVLVVSDVTEQVRFDRMKDEFMAVAAHELKTPVAVMKGYAQLLTRTGEPLSPQVRKAVDAIDRGADRIDKIVRDLLDVSRLRLGQLRMAGEEEVDVTSLVEQVVTDVARTTRAHTLRLTAAEPAVVSGDRARLEQVLVNLLSNAIKYSPGGGDIDVAVVTRGDEVVVSVRDRGVGIPAEKQAHIFERFYRAHTGTPHDYGGIGLGLYLTWEIVRAHGGRIWFESVEGEGSTFHVALPRRGSR